MKNLHYFIIAVLPLILVQIIDVEAIRHADIKKLTIGFIPVENTNELKSSAKNLEVYLEQYFRNIDIEIVIPTNYETIIEGMRFGHIDAAFMDSGSGWIAHKKIGAEVIFAEVVNGKINYKSTIYSRSDDMSIKSIYDTIGKRVAFTSFTGSSGFIIPVGKLITDGYIEVHGNDLIALETSLMDTFESYVFAGGYKAALKLLINGNVDVAFASDNAPQNFLTGGEIKKIKVVETIGSVPSHVFVVKHDMPNLTIKLLSKALVNLNYDEYNYILKNIYGADALLPTSTSLHIGEFGNFIDSLTGIEEKLLNKYKK